MLSSVYLDLYCLNSYSIISNLVLFEGSQFEYKKMSLAWVKEDPGVGWNYEVEDRGKFHYTGKIENSVKGGGGGGKDMKKHSLNQVKANFTNGTRKGPSSNKV